MSLFDNSTKKNKLSGTTEGFFFGAPEAEAEKKFETDNDVSFFGDYFDVIHEISSGKFIISGRKGTGKSAVAKHFLEANEEDETYVDIVLPKEYVICKNAIHAEDGVEITSSMVWEWIVLTRFVRMILKNESGKYIREFKPLELFWKNNSGFLDIDKFDAKEIISKNSGQLSFAPLKQIMAIQFQKLFNVKMVHAPFYKLIPALREIVERVLRYNVYKKIDYVLMFDDLDIKFRLDNENDKMDLMELIRIAKDYNTIAFSGTNARILIFIRDDVRRKMQNIATDTCKVFGSYEYQLKWYNHEIGDDDDNRNRIKQFINHRLQINFKKLDIKYNENDPWQSFVEDDISIYDRKTPFKYLLDFTFYRPRDFINIFKDLGQRRYKLPLSPTNIKTLLSDYVKWNYDEIIDELTIVFSSSEIVKIKKILKAVANVAPITYCEVTKLIADNDLSADVLDTLVDYNLLIPQDNNKNQYFSYREKSIDEDLEKYSYALPKSVYAYYKPTTILPGV